MDRIIALSLLVACSTFLGICLAWVHMQSERALTDLITFLLLGACFTFAFVGLLKLASIVL